MLRMLPPPRARCSAGSVRGGKRFPCETIRLRRPRGPLSQQVERFSPHALVLDMDGLMVDSEPLWFQVERGFAAARGGVWTHALALRCVGRGTAYTLRTMGEVFGFAVDVQRDTAAIFDAFVERLEELALKP